MKATLPEIRLTQWADCAGCAAKMDALALVDALNRLPKREDPNLLVGVETSDDAGVYRIAENLALVETVDFFPPLVDDPYIFGQIAAANALSDIYAMGAKPVTALNLVAFPNEGLAAEVLHNILLGGVSKLDEAGAALVGGHSIMDREVKYGLAVTGLVDPAETITNAGAQAGDSLVLTKPIGVGVITTAIKQGRADALVVERATAVMTLLNRRASELMLEFGVHACTDISGYGLLGHAMEMARASGVSLELDHAVVPCIPGARELCTQGFKSGGLDNNRRAFSPAVRMSPTVSATWQDLLFDPQTSGGLLMALPEAAAIEMRRKLMNERQMDIAVIGKAAVKDKRDAWILVR